MFSQTFVYSILHGVCFGFSSFSSYSCIPHYSRTNFLIRSLSFALIRKTFNIYSRFFVSLKIVEWTKLPFELLFLTSIWHGWYRFTGLSRKYWREPLELYGRIWTAIEMNEVRNKQNVGNFFYMNQWQSRRHRENTRLRMYVLYSHLAKQKITYLNIASKTFIWANISNWIFLEQSFRSQVVYYMLASWRSKNMLPQHMFIVILSYWNTYKLNSAGIFIFQLLQQQQKEINGRTV